METKRYIDADAMIVYLNGLKGLPGILYGEKKMLEEIISSVQDDADKISAAPTGLDWRTPDVWPKKEEADFHGRVLAVNRDDGYISSWPAASIISRPDTFYCWAPVPEIPSEPVRPQEDEDGQD